MLDIIGDWSIILYYPVTRMAYNAIILPLNFSNSIFSAKELIPMVEMANNYEEKGVPWNYLQDAEDYQE